MMAMVQVRRPSAGQAYYRRRLAEGKSAREALRCLKRRLSDAVYRCLLADQLRCPPPGDSGVAPVTFSERSAVILAP
jgi:transposase